MTNNMQGKQGAIVRLVVLIILVINQSLVTFGWNPLPFSEEEIFAGVSSLGVVVAGLWNWWKNNDWTPEAVKGTKHMQALKDKEAKVEGRL